MSRVILRLVPDSTALQQSRRFAFHGQVISSLGPVACQQALQQWGYGGDMPWQALGGGVGCVVDAFGEVGGDEGVEFPLWALGPGFESFVASVEGATQGRLVVRRGVFA